MPPSPSLLQVSKLSRSWVEAEHLYYISFYKIVQETRAQIWPNLALEYICRFMIDSLSTDSSLFKSAGCQTVNFGHLMLFAFEK